MYYVISIYCISVFQPLCLKKGVPSLKKGCKPQGYIIQYNTKQCYLKEIDYVIQYCIIVIGSMYYILF